ncbi:MAG: oxidoreductase [Marinibacterium sp.]|nr:oxidoreductase [Marinibacterium sp.]
MINITRALCTICAISVSTLSMADEVILTVTGDVGAPSGDPVWTFDLPALQSLPVRRIETTTIWTDGLQQFDGVSLAVLLDHVGAADGAIEAVALNDYAVTIPTSDATPDGPIVAYLRDGAPISVRDKGPLWIIYPYDDNEAYQSEEIYARSIWQLDRLTITGD